MQEKQRKSPFGHAPFVLCLASVAWAVLPVRAGDKIPSGAAIMDMYVKRSGGKEAYARIKNRVTRSVVDSPTGEMVTTTYHAEPDKQYVERESLKGVVKRGSNGEVAWQQSKSSAVLRKDGMRKRSLVNGFFHMPLKWRDLCTKAECKEIVKIAGKDCYKVELSTIHDFPQTYFIEVETMLPRAIDQTIHRGSQHRTFGLVLADYKKVDGILYPHEIERTVDGRHQVTIIVQSIKHNVELPIDVFELPAEVVDLIAEE
jgi:hypothetical protein